MGAFFLKRTVSLRCNGMNLFKWLDPLGRVAVRLLQGERSLTTLSVFVLFLGFAYGQEQYLLIVICSPKTAHG
jgi:hypothetical protein